MIFTPWGLGLTTCSLALLMLLARAAIPSVMLLIRGEKSDSEFQLRLEREEVLSNAILSFALIYQILSPFLLIMAAFELGRQIPGAMCAFGAFNANVFGFPLVVLRLIGIYPAFAWVVLYSTDMRLPTTPLRGVRRILIIVGFILFLADAILQTLYLLNLNPQVITSCCAVIFDPTDDFMENPAGILAKYPTPFVFYSIAFVMLCTGVAATFTAKGFIKLIYGMASPIFFFFCFTAVISFISPYVYALPNHHCPFCILTGKEAVLGIPLTVLIFVGGLFGWAGGVVEWASRVHGLSLKSGRMGGYHLPASIISFALFTTGSAGIIILYQIYGELI